MPSPATALRGAIMAVTRAIATRPPVGRILGETPSVGCEPTRGANLIDAIARASDLASAAPADPTASVPRWAGSLRDGEHASCTCQLGVATHEVIERANIARRRPALPSASALFAFGLVSVEAHPSNDINLTILSVALGR